MFHDQLQKRLSAIFGFRKTTFDNPSEAFEQDTLFVDVIEPRVKAHKGWATARVTGSLTIFVKDDAVPWGFFNKRLEQADPELTKPFFFYEIDRDVASSTARVMNIRERRTSFVFLFEQQYDPEQGQLTSLET